MPYNSKSSLIADQQLKVQELSVRFSDLGLYEASGNDVAVEMGETVLAIVCCLNLDASGPDCFLNDPADNAISDGDSDDSLITITLPAPFASDDVLVIKYITHQ